MNFLIKFLTLLEFMLTFLEFYLMIYSLKKLSSSLTLLLMYWLE